jgi:D-methionine transport system permease protein
MGASPWRIIRTVVIPEALGPLILGYTFIFVAIVDMSALAGMIAGGGLGAFALQYGYQRFDWPLTLITVAVIVVFVQSVQFFGNWLSRKIMRR